MRHDKRFDSHNYCEILVLEKIKAMPEVMAKGEGFVSDVICIALNRLKPRYIREQIYLFFHITDAEWAEINAEVAQALDFAIHHIGQNRRTAGNRDSEIITIGGQNYSNEEILVEHFLRKSNY